MMVLMKQLFSEGFSDRRMFWGAVGPSGICPVMVFVTSAALGLLHVN